MATVELANDFKLDKDKNVIVLDIKNQYRNWLEQLDRENYRHRLQENFKFYSGVNYNQWSDPALALLNEQQRPAHTFNYTQGIVQDIVGRLEQNQFDTNFDPIQSNVVDEVNLLNDLFDYDFERGDYEFSKLSFKRDGLIFKGVLKMFVDYTHDPLGNIGLKNINPSFIIPDPNWQSDDIKDCRGVYHVSKLTAAQIKAQYKAKSQEIENAIQMSRFRNRSDSIVDKVADRSPEFMDEINNQYIVIEFVYTVPVRKKRAFDLRTGTFAEEFDKKEFQEMSDDVFKMSMRVQGNSLEMIPEEFTETRIVTVCPGLSNDLILENGLYPLQLGRLPYVFFSAENVYGERQGIVDTIKDSQEVLNKRESVATHMLGTNSNNNVFIEEDAFTDKAEEERYKRERSKGGGAFNVAEGAISQRRIAPEERAAPPNDLWNAADRAEERINTLAGRAPVMQGRSDGSNESSLLFNAKREQALAKDEMLSKILKKKDQEIAEMYMYAAIQWYPGPTRMFKNKRTGKVTFINQFTISEDNEIVVKNDISKLARHNVIITESKMGQTKKKELLSKYIELSGRITNPLSRIRYENEIIKYTDLPEDVQASIEEDNELFLQFQRMQIRTQIDAMEQQLAMSGQQQALNQIQGNEQLGTRELARLPGMGQLPNNAGVAGGESIVNNSANSSPSDFIRR